MIGRQARLYIDDKFVCIIPVSSLEGTLNALRKQGVTNVHVKEEQTHEQHYSNPLRLSTRFQTEGV